MALNEAELKKRLQAETAGVYVLYGEESYLTAYYADSIAKKTVDGEFDAFNLQRLDGQEVTVEQLEEAVESLPMMADKKCVCIRDMDVTAESDDRMDALLTELPDSCVLVFWQVTVQPNKQKGWQHFLKTAEKYGTVVRFDRKSPADAAKLLISGAKKRGCAMDGDTARYMVEQTGTDLSLLLNELEKMAALAAGGTITRQMVDAVGVKNLEARAFDLAKRILSGQKEDALLLLHQLIANREDPLAIMGALSTAFSDVYRAKVTRAAGESADSTAALFPSYKGKEFRLKKAMQNAARFSTDTLRQALEILVRTDTALKTGRGDDAVRLEQAVAELTALVR